MLEQHINNPRCLTSKTTNYAAFGRHGEISFRALAPDFVMSDNVGKSFQFYQ